MQALLFSVNVRSKTPDKHFPVFAITLADFQWLPVVGKLPRVQQNFTPYGCFFLFWHIGALHFVKQFGFAFCKTVGLGKYCWNLLSAEILRQNKLKAFFLLPLHVARLLRDCLAW